jgi:predicted nucleic acid-binding protein
VLLLDASIWIAAATPDNRWESAAGSLIRRPPRPLAALDLTLYEVANVVGVRYRDPAGAKTVASLVRRRSRDRLVPFDPELFDAALALAAEHGLSAYDAAYVAAARRHGWTLVSIDVRDLVSKGLAVTPDAALYP